MFNVELKTLLFLNSVPYILKFYYEYVVHNCLYCSIKIHVVHKCDENYAFSKIFCRNWQFLYLIQLFSFWYSLCQSINTLYLLIKHLQGLWQFTCFTLTIFKSILHVTCMKWMLKILACSYKDQMIKRNWVKLNGN